MRAPPHTITRRQNGAHLHKASAEIRQPPHEQSALNESTRHGHTESLGLALVLHVSRITPGKCTAGLNKSVIR